MSPANRPATTQGAITNGALDAARPTTPGKPVTPGQRPDKDLPIGTPVRYWAGARVGPGRLSRTRTETWRLSGQLVVAVVGHAGGIALSHIEVVAEGDLPDVFVPLDPAAASAGPADTDEIPRPTGSYEDLRAEDVRRLRRIATRIFGGPSMSVDELAEVLLRDGWRRG